MSSTDAAGEIFIILMCLYIIGIFALFIFLIVKAREANKQLEIKIFQIMKEIPPHKQLAFSSQYYSVRKNSVMALILNFFLGGIGIHKFYLGDTGTGVLYLLFSWTSIPSIASFIDLFFITKKANEKNLASAQEIAFAIIP